MKAITVRITDAMRNEMKEFEDVNWSEEIRDSIEKKLKLMKMKDACKVQDKLRKKSSARWSGVAEIRKWREKRK